jgi:hypothetical protein
MKLSSTVQEIINLANSFSYVKKYTTVERWDKYENNGHLAKAKEYNFENYNLYFNVYGNNTEYIIEKKGRGVFYVLK